MYLKIAVWIGLGAFALLSAADWLLTYKILTAFPTAMETNPLAAVCLKHGGWSGLAVYKALTVLVFFGGVYMLLKRRPPVAVGVVVLGCSALVAVTLYSHNLLSHANRAKGTIPTEFVATQPDRNLADELSETYIPQEYFPPLVYHPVEESQIASQTPESNTANAATH
jgi:hypothetical protein